MGASLYSKALKMPATPSSNSTDMTGKAVCSKSARTDLPKAEAWASAGVVVSAAVCEVASEAASAVAEASAVSAPVVDLEEVVAEVLLGVQWVAQAVQAPQASMLPRSPPIPLPTSPLLALNAARPSTFATCPGPPATTIS